MPTPAEVILRKAIVTHGTMSSADWEVVDAAIKDRAFISSRVASVNFLDTCQAKLADLLANARNGDGALVSRAEVVSEIMRSARAEGIALGTGGLADPGSEARANVIIDTNAGMAAGYVQAEMSNTYGARLAFPAQELIRIEDREKKRNWQRRWLDAGGHLYNGRMIALKDDPVWTAISRFGMPYPPFDFNSGMGVEDVSYDEAVALGVIKPEYKPPETSPIKEFNEGLEMSMKVPGVDSPRQKELQGIFGDQIQYNPHTKSLKFDGAMIHDVVRQIKAEVDAGMRTTTVKTKPSVGRPSKLFCEKASLPENTDRNLKLSPSNMLHVLQDHVGVDKDPNNNIPLTERELGLIGHIWRNPDSVEPADHGYWMCLKQASDGGAYRLIISVDQSNGGLAFHSFYKTKK